MAKLDPLFPKQIILNGADYFLLQLDQIMLQSSGRRNVCTFVLELEDQLEPRRRCDCRPMCVDSASDPISKVPLAPAVAFFDRQLWSTLPAHGLALYVDKTTRRTLLVSVISLKSV